MTPTKRLVQLAACAVSLAVAPTAARAVSFHSTGDVSFNTAAPTGSLANSGWQYQIDIGPFSGTPVGPYHYLTAAHTGAGTNNSFVYNGVTYHTTQLAGDFGDLRLLRVDKPFLSYAPLYDASPLADGSENTKSVVVFGRGVQRGELVTVRGEDKGWKWGAYDGVRRWGTNNVAGFATGPGGASLLSFTFDRGAGDTEAALGDKDSGGGVFIADANGQWKLAGVNFAVTGPYSTDGNPNNAFNASLYDAGGLYNHGTDPVTFVPNAPADVPSSWYASRVSDSLASIRPLLNLPPTWKANANGSWMTSGNWANGGVPNAVGAIADFRTAINAPRTVSFTGTVTAGTLDFDSAHGYALAASFGAPSQLKLDVASGNAVVNVASGSHSITGLSLQDPTVFNIVQPSSTLTVSMGATAQPITKEGAGTLAVNRLQSGAVTVKQGTLRMIANGNPNTVGEVTNKVAGVSVGGSGVPAKLDLGSNDMIVANTPVGTRSGSTYTGLTGLIAQARGDGDWTGSGITSSAAATTSGLTTLAIARAGDVLDFGAASTKTWSGQTVTADDALIAYTYAGDANLDGSITGDDYSAIDFGILIPGMSGYANGDFNYDGFVTGDDYSVIDLNILLQGPPLIPPALALDAAPAGMTGVSAVPEPASWSLVAFASAALRSRRRHRRT